MTQKQILLAIENERERRGMDTRELARRAGVSESTISWWMKSDTSPSLGKLIRVAEALGMVVLCCENRLMKIAMKELLKDAAKTDRQKTV